MTGRATILKPNVYPIRFYYRYTEKRMVLISESDTSPEYKVRTITFCPVDYIAGGQ